MKKRCLLRIIVVITIIVVFAFSILCRPVYYRLYFGDRIKGNIRMTVNDEIYQLDNNITFFSDSGRASCSDEGKYKLAFHDDEYGSHVFLIDCSELKEPVRIECYQHNWWNVMDFELDISVNTHDKTIVYVGYYSTIFDSGIKNKESINTIQHYESENTSLSFGL